MTRHRTLLPATRRRLLACIAGALAGVGAPCVHAQVYMGVTADSGTIVLSNFPSAQTPDTLLPGNEPAPVALLAPPASTAAPRPSPALARPSAELRRLIDAVASRVQVPADLLHAVIAAESNYDLKARSSRGAMGLMQLMPDTARRFGAKDPFDASDNLMAGASYLKWLMRLFDDDLPLVLAAYNAGEQAVLKAGRRIPPFPETQAYVPRVLALRQEPQAARR